MLAATVLVTVWGPLRTLDIELPGDVPVRELVPVLLEMCTAHREDSQAWQQIFQALLLGGAPLSLEGTLVESGVWDGAVLVLLTYDVPFPQGDIHAPKPLRPRALQPGVETGGIGVTWHALV